MLKWMLWWSAFNLGTVLAFTSVAVVIIMLIYIACMTAPKR